MRTISPALLALAAATALPGRANADDPAERERLQERFAAVEKELASELKTLRAERRQWEDRLELVKRSVPPAFDEGQERRALEAMAAASELKIEVRVLPGSAAVRVADGRPSPFALHRIELGGADEYGRILMFLQRAAVRPRALSLEDLRLSAAPGGAVRFTARLGLPVYTGTTATAARSPAPAPAAPGTSPVAAHFEAREAHARHRVAEERAAAARARAILDTGLNLVQGSKVDRVANAVGAFARETGEEAIALTEVRAGTSVSLSGVVQGAAARAALRPALERARFEVAELKLAPTGSCQSFSATARPRPDEDPLQPPELESGARNGLFDDRTAAGCDDAQPPPLGRVVAGAVPAQGRQGVMISLRDVDAGDVFRVLHDVLLTPFVVDTDVRGRLSLDAHETATVEGLLDAMKQAGLVVGPGPFHRVSRGAVAVVGAPPRAHSGVPVTLSFKDADLLDILCLFGSIAERPVRVDPAVSGRVTVFATDRPWDQALDAIAASAGLTVAVRDDHLSLGPAVGAVSASGPVSACGRSAPSRRPAWRTLTRIDGLGPDDLRLAGSSVVGGEWTAYAYGPGRTLWTLKQDVPLFGARVAAVGPGGVEFESEGGRRTTLPFPR